MPLNATSPSKMNPVAQVPGRAVTRLKNLARDLRDRSVAGFVAAGTPLVPTREQWALLAGTSTAGINKALNGSHQKRPPTPAMADLVELLHEVADTGFRIQWRSAEVERSALEELDRLIGHFLAKHEHALDAWCYRGGTAKTLVRAVKVFDRLLTTVLSNNNIG
jgi:hypothetical protein